MNDSHERRVLELAYNYELRQENWPRFVSNEDRKRIKKDYLTPISIGRHQDGSIVMYELNNTGSKRLNELSNK